MTTDNNRSTLDRPFLLRLTQALGILLVAILIFWAGTAVGRRQADFASDWGGNYRQAFFGDDSPFGFGMMRGVRGGDMMFSANGAAGEIVAVSLPSVAVKGADEAEKIVLIGPQTVLRQLGRPASTTDIRVGDAMIAVGEPDRSGRIVATFVRLLPPPPSSAASTSSVRAR